MKRKKRDRRKNAKHSRAKLPIGSVRIRWHQGNRVQFIKVLDAGPPGYRWKEFARHWWETNGGPVPNGKCVAHYDGDTLNDSPENLFLAGPGDIIRLAHERDPKMSQLNRQQARDATAEHNRLRGTINRRLNWLPTYWYPVDVRRRVVINVPRRKKWMAIAALGIEFKRGDDDAATAAALGWPLAGVAGACLLDALKECGQLETARALECVNRTRALLGRAKPMSKGALASICVGLRRRGDVRSFRRGNKTAVYELGVEAVERAARVACVIAVRGCDLTGPEWEDCEKVEEEPRCQICGCTQNDACWDEDVGPCWWIDDFLCSHCHTVAGVELADSPFETFSLPNA